MIKNNKQEEITDGKINSVFYRFSMSGRYQPD